MGKVKYITLGLFVAAVVSVGVITGTHPTNAQTTPTETPQQTPSETPSTPPARVEARKQITAARCTVAETKIDTHIQRLTTVAEKTDSSFQKAIDKGTAFVASAESKNYPDVTTLQQALTSVKTSYESLQTSHKTYLTALTETKNFACGESEGDYAKALTSARTALIDVRAKRATTRAEVVTKLIPEMKSYLTWLKTTNKE